MQFSLSMLAGAALVLSSCAGYHLGGMKPTALRDVNKIAIPLVENETQVPRAAARLTNHLVDSLTQDGTYQLGTRDSADAELRVTIRKISYSLFRPTREDLLRAEEQEMRVEVYYELIDPLEPGKALTRGHVAARTNYFVGKNLQIAQQNALPDVLKRASESVISRLADGY